MLDETTFDQTSKWIKDKVTVLNCVPWLSFSKLFGLQELSKTSLHIIERRFTTVVDSENFLELDFTLVAAILNSSELLIDSELQVFNVMNAWLNHKRFERSKHAKYLLQTVRLSLLTVPALNNILDNNLWITENEECTYIINKAIRNKNPFNSSGAKSTNRYCSQKNFNILLVGGKNCKNEILRNVFTIDANNLSIINNLSPFKHERQFPKVVCVKGETYVFNGCDHRSMPVMNVEKYSHVTKTWNVISKMYDWRINCCACSFIDSFYVLGGFSNDYSNSCLVFNTTNETWKEIARMNEARSDASCVVFRGSVVVTGGFNKNDGILNTVEAYDHIDNSWSNMPSMIKRRYYHKSVAIKNKLFLVGGVLDCNIEVFDSHCNKFVLLRCPNDLSYTKIADVASFANKVLIFSNKKGLVIRYDVENDVWSEKRCKSTKRIEYFSCVKVQKLYHI